LVSGSEDVLHAAAMPNPTLHQRARSVKSVDFDSSALDSPLLHAFFIESPIVGATVLPSGLDVRGWVIGRSVPARAVEIVHNGQPPQQLPLDQPRPDVRAVHPQAVGVKWIGFHSVVSLPDVPESELVVQALLDDETRVPLAVIHVVSEPNASQLPSDVWAASRHIAELESIIHGQNAALAAYRQSKLVRIVQVYWRLREKGLSVVRRAWRH
jgi:hypothetical protein